MICPKCQHQNKDGARYCGGCGSPLTEPIVPTVNQAPQDRRCARCGTPLSPGAKFCGSCGSTLHQEPATPPPPSVPPGPSPVETTATQAPEVISPPRKSGLMSLILLLGATGTLGVGGWWFYTTQIPVAKQEKVPQPVAASTQQKENPPPPLKKQPVSPGKAPQGVVGKDQSVAPEKNQPEQAPPPKPVSQPVVQLPPNKPETVVVVPRLSIVQTPSRVMVGQEVTLTVQSDPTLSPDQVKYRWNIPGQSEASAGGPNAVFTPRDPAAVVATVTAYTPQTDRELSHESIMVVPTGYSVSILAPHQAGGTAQEWRCDTNAQGLSTNCGMRSKPEGDLIVGQNILMEAQVDPMPLDASYQWTVVPTGACTLPEALPRLRMQLQCNTPGTHRVQLEMFDSKGWLLAKVGREFSVRKGSEPVKSMATNKKEQPALTGGQVSPAPLLPSVPTNTTTTATEPVAMARNSEVNLAQGKPAKQSSTYTQDGLDHGAHVGVDGQIENKRMFRTQADDLPWWQVDLGTVREISLVRLHSLADRKELSYDLELLSSQNGKKWKSLFVNEQGDFDYLDIAMPEQEKARYIKIQLRERGELSLIEVEVLGPGGS